jgi:hypothetical protein
MDRLLSRTAFLLCFAAGLAGCAASNEAIESRVEESRSLEAYGKYRNELARSNIEREKAGQAPVPILDREEWAGSEEAKKQAAGEQ